MIRAHGDGLIPRMRLTSYVDAPPGSGLGSSSALVVALVAAFNRLLGACLGPYDIARTAWKIERHDLGLPGGRQDQYAAAFGGINLIEFRGDRSIVNPVPVAASVLNELEAALVVCFTGISRRSEAIITEQQSRMAHDDAAIAGLHQLKADALAMKQALLAGDIPRMATILNGSWEAKKRTAGGVSSDGIEALLHAGFTAGAIGGKVSGAGGGGFMMFIVPPERRISVIKALNAAGGEASSVHLTARGAKSWVSPSGPFPVPGPPEWSPYTGQAA